MTLANGAQMGNDSVQAVIEELRSEFSPMARRCAERLQAILDSHKEPDAWHITNPQHIAYLRGPREPMMKMSADHWQALYANPYELKVKK